MAGRPPRPAAEAAGPVTPRAAMTAAAAGPATGRPAAAAIAAARADAGAHRCRRKGLRGDRRGDRRGEGTQQRGDRGREPLDRGDERPHRAGHPRVLLPRRGRGPRIGEVPPAGDVGQHHRGRHEGLGHPQPCPHPAGEARAGDVGDHGQHRRGRRRGDRALRVADRGHRQPAHQHVHRLPGAVQPGVDRPERGRHRGGPDSATGARNDRHLQHRPSLLATRTGRRSRLSPCCTTRP